MSQNDDLQKKLQLLKHEVADLTRLKARLTTESGELELKIMGQKDELRIVDTLIDTSGERIKTLEVDLRDKTAEFGHFQQKNVDLAKINASLEEQIHRAEHTLAVTRQSTKQLQEDMQAERVRLADLQMKLDNQSENMATKEQNILDAEMRLRHNTLLSL